MVVENAGPYAAGVNADVENILRDVEPSIRQMF
jgi:hypothetical protein